MASPRWPLAAGAAAGVAAATLALLWRRLRRPESLQAPEPEPEAAGRVAEAVAEPADEAATAASRPVLSWDDLVEDERRVVLEAVDAIALVRKTGAFRSLPHPHSAERQLLALERLLREVADYLAGGSYFWRYGRDEPMLDLLGLPLLHIAAAEGAMVPASLGYVKDTRAHGAVAIARYLVSGTDPEMSRYRERSCGILDAVHCDKLLRSLQKLNWSCWDMPLTWGDEDDCVALGGANPHNASAFGVAMRTQWEGFTGTTGLSS